MKKLLIFMVLIFLVNVPNIEAENRSKKKIYIHPTFKHLLKIDPRGQDKTMTNLMVPRISAKASYRLYKTGKAVFFAVGDETAEFGLPGAITIHSVAQGMSLPFIRKVKKIKNKPLILF